MLTGQYAAREKPEESVSQTPGGGFQGAVERSRNMRSRKGPVWPHSCHLCLFEIFLLEQSPFTMLQQFQAYIRVNLFHISTLFQILFPYTSLQGTEQFPVLYSKQVLISYLFYVSQCVYVKPSLLIYPSLPFSLKKAMAPHSSTLAWKNPMDRGAWQAAVHGVTKSQTLLSDFTFTFVHWRRKWQPTPVFLPGESQGQGSLVGGRLWGCTESDMTEATQHACMHWRRKWHPTPVFLPGESQGQGSLVGGHLWLHRFGHD